MYIANFKFNIPQISYNKPLEFLCSHALHFYYTKVFFHTVKAVLHGTLNQHYVILMVMMSIDRYFCLRNLPKYLIHVTHKVSRTFLS